MEDNWKSIKEALTSTCQEALSLKKHRHKEWISIETLDQIKERKIKKTAINNSRTRAEKVQAQAEYTEANKQVKRSIRTDKKKYVEELATTAEKAAREGNMKQLYDTTKKLSGKYSKPERPVKDKEGKPITEIQQQRDRWVEYIEELLNRPAPMNPPYIEAAHTDLPIDTKLQYYGSSSNNQLSGTRHCTSTSLIMKRHLTVWTGGRYGNFFDTTEFLRRLSILSGTHVMDYSAKSCMEDS
ncbi:unnamed protein product [Schistosoma margrebowiei]|uniref:Uncharacterized protein n=1 Tax=Schistosoma margrebowiei TaxID=48269 RepID=A0A183LVV3_9TREM|nr:unnamed protein product [Schistosoma margrebowiei]